MITLIHGEDSEKSRNFYYDLKQKIKDDITFDGIILSQTDLQQSLSGQDLFGETKNIFIEDLLSKRKGAKDIEPFIDIINNSESNIVLWESKEVSSKLIGLLKNPTITLFKIPSTIFVFLDAVRPNNGKQLIQLFHKTLEDKEAEFVLFMLTRLVRTLLAIQNSSENQISEVARLAPWQKGKLEKQAAVFTTNQLIDLHSKLFQLELKMKTGGLSLPLGDEIDFLLISL